MSTAPVRSGADRSPVRVRAAVDIIACGDILPPLLSEAGLLPAPFELPISDRSLVLALLSSLVLFPLSLPREMSSLRHVSGVAVIMYTMFTLSLVMLYASGSAEPLQPPPSLWKPGLGGFVRAAPLTVFSFQCVVNLFPVYQELREPTPRSMTSLSAAAISAAAAIYTACGLAAYGHFGESLQARRARVEPASRNCRLAARTSSPPCLPDFWPACPNSRVPASRVRLTCPHPRARPRRATFCSTSAPWTRRSHA